MIEFDDWYSTSKQRAYESIEGKKYDRKFEIIEEQLLDFDMSLHGNKAFQDWAETGMGWQDGKEVEMRAPLPEELVQLFTEGDDFETVEELQTALQKLWRFRAGNGFESELVMMPPMFPQVESCPKDV